MIKLEKNNDMDFIDYIDKKFNYYVLKYGEFERELIELKNEKMRYFLSLNTTFAEFMLILKKSDENYRTIISISRMAKAIKHDEVLYNKFIENIKQVLEEK